MDAALWLYTTDRSCQGYIGWCGVGEGVCGVRSHRTSSSRGSNVGLIWTLLSGSTILTGNVRPGYGGIRGEGGLS